MSFLQVSYKLWTGISITIGRTIRFAVLAVGRRTARLTEHVTIDPGIIDWRIRVFGSWREIQPALRPELLLTLVISGKEMKSAALIVRVPYFVYETCCCFI